MQRRDLIKWIAAVTGSAFVGVDAVLAADIGKATPGDYTRTQVALFDEIAETIMPRTDTPGAKDAGVGPFIARYSSACYKPEQVAALKAGLVSLDKQMHARFGMDFMHAKPAQRQAMLEAIDRESKRDHQPPHWFTMCKQLTLYGFFTSEPGATKVARDRPIPGKYHGCVEYHKGETFWA